MKNKTDISIDTKCIHAGYDPKNGEPRQIPIIQSTTFKYDTSEDMGALFDLEKSGYFYTRLQNPTNDFVAAKLASLEGGTAGMLTSSGQAANFFAIFNICEAGSHIVASSSIYGGTFNLISITLKKMGIDATFVEPDASEDELNAAFKSNTRAVFGETIANPALTVLDIEKFAKAAHDHNVPLIVDNTFPTPINCRPIEWGADIVTHSTTKYLDGHGACVGGAVIDAGKFDWAKSKKWPWLTEPNPSYHGVRFAVDTAPAVIATYLRAITIRDEGAAISPFNAWVLIQGLESLALRVERHRDNALKVVEYLKKHPKVESVSHPAASTDPAQQALYKKYLPNGGGSIFTFTVKGNERTAKDFIDNLELFSLLANVADVKSLAIHPASTTHSEGTKEELLEQGIQENSVRLSIGIENVEDIIEDLEEAFKAI